MPAVLERPNYADPIPAKKPAGKAALCKGRERAPSGYTRYRVRSDYPQHAARYVLAVDEEAARAEYLRVANLGEAVTEAERDHAAWREDVKKNPRLPQPPRVRLVIEAMPD